MAISEIDLAKIKVDFESGKLNKSKVAQKHSISRNTLDKYAKEKGWIYATNERDLSRKIELLTLERLVNDEVDRATQITNNFLGDVEKYRKLAMIPASELAQAYSEAQKDKREGKKGRSAGRVPKEEFSRIWESTKVIKTAIEGLKLGYDGARKALGMDRDDDIEKARRLKQTEKQPVLDPCEDLTEEEVDAKLQEFE